MKTKTRRTPTRIEIAHPTNAKLKVNAVEADYPELVFGFVAPIGVDLTIAEGAVSDRLRELGYQAERIDVTRHVLPNLDAEAVATFSSSYSRLKTMMKVGTAAREKHDEDIIALGIAAEIASRRKNPDKFRSKTAYIVHSLKHPAEVRRLRELYPRGFYLIAVNAPPDTRRNFLIRKRGLTEGQADELMLKDKKENVDYGQQVNQTFHLADFFVGWADDAERIEKSVYRFVDITFGDPHRTPTFGEYAMFLAFAASVRSADLSRQVGAVIAKDGEILSTGANDCPKVGGGLYWPIYNPKTKSFEDVEKGRDSQRGVDSNREAQLQIISEIANECNNVKIPRKYVTKLKTILEDSSIADLTEFGRVVHAEMEALLACGRKGVQTRGATIYCTTFPCHNCAKHIIAAGIKRVVFVEPYLKSKATTHHDEIIKIEYPKPADSISQDENFVRFEPFFGIGPRRFFDLFSMNLGLGTVMKRKDKKSGKATTWSTGQAGPRVKMLARSYLEAETIAAQDFRKRCIQKAKKIMKRNKKDVSPE